MLGYQPANSSKHGKARQSTANHGKARQSTANQRICSNALLQRCSARHVDTLWKRCCSRHGMRGNTRQLTATTRCMTQQATTAATQRTESQVAVTVSSVSPKGPNSNNSNHFEQKVGHFCMRYLQTKYTEKQCKKECIPNEQYQDFFGFLQTGTTPKKQENSRTL